MLIFEMARADNPERMAKGWQTDTEGQQTDSKTDSKRLAKGILMIPEGYIVWKERFFEG